MLFPKPNPAHLREELADFILIEHRLTLALPRLLRTPDDPGLGLQLVAYLGLTRDHIARLEHQLNRDDHPAAASGPVSSHPPVPSGALDHADTLPPAFTPLPVVHPAFLSHPPPQSASYETRPESASSPAKRARSARKANRKAQRIF